MTAILDHPQVRNLRVGDRQTARVSSGGRPATLPGRGSVVALRQRRAIALGSLAERGVLAAGDRLVTAHDATGHSWWIPADAVWSDADGPRPSGAPSADRPGNRSDQGSSARQGHQRPARVGSGAGVRARRRPPRGDRGGGVVGRQRHRPRRAARPRRSDGRRPRRRHDALGCWVDVERGDAPGPLRRRSPGGPRRASSAASANCSPPTGWRSPVSTSARRDCMPLESFVAPCRSSQATARYVRGTRTE